MPKFYKKLFILGCLALLGSGFLWWKNSKQSNNAFLEVKKVEVAIEKTTENKIETVEEKKEQIVDKKMPNKISIAVPFSSQAPLGKWDAFHEEACEEASLLMLKYYLDGKKLTPEIAEREIQAMLAYEIKHYGKYEDSDAEEIVKLARDFYGIKNLQVVYDFSPEDLKKYLSLGHPIIVPAAGRLLGNPNFKAPGPLYHNLVLTGYEENRIITNDPGTRKGQSYQYDINTLYTAIHDFPGNLRDIEKGRKAMIVVE